MTNETLIRQAMEAIPNRKPPTEFFRMTREGKGTRLVTTRDKSQI